MKLALSNAIKNGIYCFSFTLNKVNCNYLSTLVNSVADREFAMSAVSCQGSCSDHIMVAHGLSKLQRHIQEKYHLLCTLNKQAMN